MFKTYIYSLSDPRTPNKIRYIGKANNLKIRLNKHINDAKLRKEKTHKNNWIKSLLDQGIIPCMDVLEEVEYSNDEEWQSVERFYISYLSSLGCELTNISIGGHGGGSLSKETKDKLKQIRNTKEFKQKVSNRHTGIKLTEKQKENLRFGKAHIKMTPEWCANISKGRKGMKFSQSHKLAMSNARKGKPTGIIYTDEIRSKIKQKALEREARKRQLLAN